jgi:hypothetical protein
MKIRVELEYDENSLGPMWMNKDNLELLLYAAWSTKPEFLKINSYEEIVEKKGSKARFNWGANTDKLFSVLGSDILVKGVQFTPLAGEKDNHPGFAKTKELEFIVDKE